MEKTIRIHVLDHCCKIIPISDVPGKTEAEMEEWLDEHSQQGWELRSVIPGVDAIVMLMVRFHQSRVVRPTAQGTQQFGRKP